LAFILINDYLKYIAGNTTLSNPLKSIPSKQKENMLKLLEKLRMQKGWDNLSNEELYKSITKYLIKELA
jgi:hypothetical protein